jgi:hypothetical protein
LRTRIYVVNHASHDLSQAERFGELHYLSQGPLNRYSTNKIYLQFFKALENSKPTDYILPTGLTIMSIIATGIFTQLHGRLNLLLFKPKRFDNEDDTYIERTIIFNERKKGARL